jgi:23S rRNA pseudouridine2604 synthase
MSYRNKLQYLLVQKLAISKKEAKELIITGKVKMNGAVVFENCVLSVQDEISFENKIIKERTVFHYIAFYKPRGIETTLNTSIENNLLTVFQFSERLFPVGRLDKESEGLLLMTNDGRIMNKISGGWFDKEKEYEVSVNKMIIPAFIGTLATGIRIMGKLTRPAIVRQVNDTTFSIILTEGMNRQIRRMCYKQGYEVTELKRVRIMNIGLGMLQAGEYRALEEKELQDLKAGISLE